MTIGIDISPLQGSHRMRGIGYTLLNFINNISKADRGKHVFVLYAYPYGEDDDPLDLLDLEGMDYEVRPLRKRRRINRHLPGRLNLFVSAANQLIELRDLHFGDSRIKDLSGIDFFLQTDQSERLPRRRWGMKRGLVIYDIIPYVLEWDYLWSYRTARLRGFSRKAALRVYARRWLYAHKIKVNVRRADRLLSISGHTRRDFIKYLGAKDKKISVTPLGVNMPDDDTEGTPPTRQYLESSWGYVRRPLELGPETPFILYVGGADRRRRLNDLVAAFNMLRARGHDLKLVLAGDCMQGPWNIATEEIQYALRASSYKEDIVYMGFVADDTRDWLYKHARAFVFPSKYEGFGLPVLEAMSYGAPVITYRNGATEEVSGDAPLYAGSAEGLAEGILKVISASSKQTDTMRRKGLAQAKKYSWSSTSKDMLQALGD